MKISPLAIATLFLAAGTTTAESPKLRALRALVESDPVAVINSQECEPLLREFDNALEDMMLQKESNVEAFLCNPFQRKKTKQIEMKMEAGVARTSDEGVNPCILAGEKLILENKRDLTDALSNTKSCKAEVKKERAQLMQFNGRALVTEDGHRSLFVCGGLCIGGIALAGSAIVGGSKLGAAAIEKSKKRRRNRKLEASLDYDTIEEVAQTCKNEDYSLFMYIENETSSGSPHINMVANPLESNKDGCKDAVTFDDYNLGERLISYVEDIGFGDDWQKSSLPLGTFALGQMKAAADSAEVVMPFKYDMMTSNCATFVIEMMGFLKIPINQEVKEYVVNSLVTSETMVQTVMGSTEVVLAPDGLPMEEHKEAMWKFVSEYIEDNQK